MRLQAILAAQERLLAKKQKKAQERQLKEQQEVAIAKAAARYERERMQQMQMQSKPKMEPPVSVFGPALLYPCNLRRVVVIILKAMWWCALCVADCL